MGSTMGGLLAGLDPNSPAVAGGMMVLVAVVGRLAAHFVPKTSVAQSDLALNLNPIKASFTILRQTLARRNIFLLMMLISFFWFSGTIYFSIAPAYGSTLLKADNSAIVILNMALTMGIGIGSLVCSKVSFSLVKPISLVPYASLLMAATTTSIWLFGPPESLASSLTAKAFFFDKHAIVFFFQLSMIGVSGAIFVIPLYTELQKNTLSGNKARIFAALNIFNSLFIVCATGFISLLYKLNLELEQMFAITGAGALGISVLASRYILIGSRPIRTRNDSTSHKKPN